MDDSWGRGVDIEVIKLLKLKVYRVIGRNDGLEAFVDIPDDENSAEILALVKRQIVSALTKIDNELCFMEMKEAKHNG